MLLRISIFWVFLVSATAAQAQTVASFETTNFPGSFLQHADSVGYIRAAGNENERNNSSFVITPSPFGNNAVFLLTAMDPTKYIRHQNLQIFAARNEHSIAFYEDASFNISAS